MVIIKEDFYAYIKSLIGIEVNDNTMFFGGIGMDGLDAWTFIETIAQRYDVDFSSYNWEEYHVGEADVANVFKALNDIFKNKKPLLEFSALHLFNVVEAGRWFLYS